MATKFDEYTQWITKHIGDNKGYAQCVEICQAMHTAFPELQPRKGIFHSDWWGERTHWWLRAPCGRIVDPTGRQHPDGSWLPSSTEKYEDLTEAPEEQMADRVPTGVCADCGDPVYRDASFCSEGCKRATMAYLDSI